MRVRLPRLSAVWDDSPDNDKLCHVRLWQSRQAYLVEIAPPVETLALAPHQVNLSEAIVSNVP